MTLPKIIVALDGMGWPEAIRMASKLAEACAPDFWGPKIEGLLVDPSGIPELRSLGLPFMADRKINTTPAVAADIAARYAEMGARIITAHASGGVVMMQEVSHAIEGSGTVIAAVTVLTSHTSASCYESFGRIADDAVLHSVEQMVRHTDIDHAVMSPRETGAVKKALGERVHVIAAGIRMPGEKRHDQIRTGTPQEAVRAGADYLVIGRPITRANDPVAELRRISEHLSAT